MVNSQLDTNLRRGTLIARNIKLLAELRACAASVSAVHRLRPDVDVISSTDEEGAEE